MASPSPPVGRPNGWRTVALELAKAAVIGAAAAALTTYVTVRTLEHELSTLAADVDDLKDAVDVHTEKPWHEEAGNEIYRTREERRVLRRDVDDLRRWVYPNAPTPTRE